MRAALGFPRVHLRVVESTNERARRLAGQGAPHGTLVTASEQTAGRGRQGRTWTAPRDRAVLCSVVIRDPPRLLPLAAGVAVADVVDGALGGGPSDTGARSFAQGPRALVKWPNDVLVEGRKVAGILVEGRPQEGWAVVGMGVNVALAQEDFPSELQTTAGTLGLEPRAIEPTLDRLMDSLGAWIEASAQEVLDAVRGRDALRGQPVRWAGGAGEAAGLDDDGRLVVLSPEGRVTLEAGEVHLVRS